MRIDAERKAAFARQLQAMGIGAGRDDQMGMIGRAIRFVLCGDDFDGGRQAKDGHGSMPGPLSRAVRAARARSTHSSRRHTWA